MADERGGSDQPPAWWVVDRRAAHAARRDERRQERKARRGERKGEAPREPLTPERIADTALAIIDAEGVDGLTVRGLAQALGVGTMTVYWYVRNKDEVLDMVADRLLVGVALEAAPSDWRDAVRAEAVAVRDALLRHARAVPITVSRGSFGPNGLRLLESSLAMLRAAGFSADGAADAYFAISNYVIGCCLFEASRPGAGGDDPGPDAQAQPARAGRYVSLLPPDRFPNVVEAAPRLFAGSPDDRFAFGLECLIEGLAVRRSEDQRSGAA
jgi:TetR/AcrR family tetracycline transcriptional repressor